MFFNFFKILCARGIYRLVFGKKESPRPSIELDIELIASIPNGNNYTNKFLFGSVNKEHLSSQNTLITCFICWYKLEVPAQYSLSSGISKNSMDFLTSTSSVVWKVDYPKKFIIFCLAHKQIKLVTVKLKKNCVQLPSAWFRGWSI